MEVISNFDLDNELIFLVKQFDMPDDFVCVHNQILQDKMLKNQFSVRSQTLNLEKDFCFENPFEADTAIKQKSLNKRLTKLNLYDALHSITGKNLPWGCLTGVRPTKFARDLVEKWGEKEYLLAEVLEIKYRLSKEKAKLVVNTLKNQKCIIKNDNLVDLYINIPICPTRCLYCSFISHELAQVKDKVDAYLNALIKELRAVKKIIAKKAFIVRNIYIGGGTPTVLQPDQLEKLLSEIAFTPTEFTVECGRPDTITAEKLDVLKKFGVTRISINPQTFCQATLKRIGRAHTIKDVFDAYLLALQKDFVVNMDLIAGLPGEKLATFKRSIKTAIELAPDNITLHTLSIKNGADLKFNMSAVDDSEVEKMVEFGQKALLENGYKPYYLYRQKNQLKGLENVGFFKEKVCAFNIDSMEETNTIIAVGANALSKRVFNIEERIERLPNVKFIDDYIARIDELIAKKEEFFK